MFRKLLTTQRFAPLFWCQFFAAFNDNFLKNALVFLIVFQLGHAGGTGLVTVAGAVFSVIGPEAGSMILYRNPARAQGLARSLRLTATDLHDLGIVDDVVPEPAPTLVEDVRAAVLGAFAVAAVGDRDRRTAAATARALVHT